MQDNFAMMMVQSIAALALVLALFAGLVWALKRLQGQHFSPLKKQHGMQVVQRLSLDNQHSIVEVSRGDCRYILGLSNGHMQLIEQLHSEPEANPATQERDDV